MKNIILFPVIILITLPFYVRGQMDTILLMKGKRIITTEYKLKGTINTDGYLTFTKENGKLKKIDLEDVFSVIDKNGVETVFYLPNKLDTSEYTVDQMRWYLKGMADINIWEFKTGSFISGLVVGASAAYLPVYEMDLNQKSLRIPTGLFTEALFLEVFNSYSPKYEVLKSAYPNIPNNPYYIEGMQDAIKDLNVNNAFIGSAVGFISAIIVSSSYNSEH